MPAMLRIEPLTAAAFAPFGDVIEAPASGGTVTNQGTALRFDRLAALDVTDGGAAPILGMFRVRPAKFPLAVTWLEAHPLASQAFMPLADRRFLVIVAPPGPAPRADAVRAFLTNGRQGVNYRRGTWHHPLVALGQETDFLVIDRGDADGNYDEKSLVGGALSVPEPV